VGTCGRIRVRIDPGARICQAVISLALVGVLADPDDPKLGDLCGRERLRHDE
jgi:hypothetical protein